MSSTENPILSFLKFFVSKTFIINIVLAIVFILVVLFGSLYYLKSFTNHGKQFFTPNFEGLSVAEAQALAKEKKIKIKVIDSVFEAHGERGSIVDQTPTFNFMIKKGRTVFLTKKTNIPQKISMPNLRNISLIQAKSEIVSYGLKIGKLDYRDSKYENLILEQIIAGEIVKPGTMIDAGTKIDLVVGRPKNDATITSVPNLKGLTKDDAALRAAGSFLNIGTAIYDKSVVTKEDTLNALIWKHSPKKNWKADLGDDVDIWLTIDNSLLVE